MKYRHKITGAVIDVDSTMGGNWQAVAPARDAQERDQREETPAADKAVKKNGVRKPK